MSDVKERLPTICMASVSSFAFLMSILGGTNCNFVEINAIQGDVLVNTEGDELEMSQAGLGVTCPNDWFTAENDSNWGISRIFFYLGIVTGLFTTMGAIALASQKVEATSTRWRNLSIGAAVTALCAVPVFLIFESNPCTQFEFQQTCKFSTGSHLQIVCTLCWVVGVAITQCMEPTGMTWKREGAGSDISPQTIDEEQGATPRSATPPIGDTLSITPNRKKDEEEKQEFESFAGAFNAFAETKEKKSQQSLSPEEGFQPIGRITVTPENGNDEVSKYPAYQEEPLKERTPFQPKMANKSEDQKDQPLSNFANFDHFEVTPPPPPAAKSHKEKLGAMIMPISQQQKKMANRLSDLKNSFQFQRPSYFARKQQATFEMLDDDVSSKGSLYNPVAVAMRGDNMSVRSSVPSEESSVVSKTMSQMAHEKLLLDDWNALHAATNAHQQPPTEVIQRHIRLDDDEEKERDDWRALHMAMTAGVRMGLIEGMSGTEDPYEVASYHPDPEPVIYSSDEDEEDNIVLSSRPNHIPQSIVRDDNSTISSHSTTSVVLRNTKSRRRSLRSKPRRQRSDLLSTTSVSLLSLTIDEETVEDILEEKSEEDLHNPYSLVRTVSAPEPRRTPAIEVSFSSSSHRRPLAGGDAGSVKTARPTIRANFGKKKTPLDTGLATPTKDPLDLGMAATPYKDPLDLGMAKDPTMEEEESPYSPYYDPLDRDPLEMQDDVNSDDKTAPRENAVIKKAAPKEVEPVPAVVTPPKPIQKPPTPPKKSAPSPTLQKKVVPPIPAAVAPSPTMIARRLQSALQEDGKRTPTAPDVASASPMVTRRMRAMARDDSSSSGSDDILDARERARRARIERMKNQSLNVSNSTDETDLNTSYASKYSIGSSLPSPAKSLPSPPIQKTTTLWEEKKEDDKSESSGRLVTPEKNATSFESDDMNVDGSSVEIIMSKGLVTPGIGADDISVITPHHDFDSDSDEERKHLEYVKAGADKVKERILNKFNFSERSHASNGSSDNSQKYGSHLMDRMNLHMIEQRRPAGAEYGEEEMSL